MPRVSRTAVEFTVDGVLYSASFTHTHLPRVAGKRKAVLRYDKIDVQHITRCRVKTLTSAAPLKFDVEGVACCSLKDHYDWLRGVKAAFERAILHAGITGMDVDGVPLPKGDPSRVRYGQFMAAFFMEMGIPISDQERIIRARIERHKKESGINPRDGQPVEHLVAHQMRGPIMARNRLLAANNPTHGMGAVCD